MRSIWERGLQRIHCLKQSGIAVHAASRISQLSAEMLAAPDDDDDPFLTWDDNETNEITVEDTDWLHLATHFLAQDIYTQCVAKTRD